ncbi:MAG: hypothetical protein JW941_04645 [Candidatus Coatesbacteria bacterium]|nr:hypothetical protein [Candidatus Coatesbacteria bacterium]
MPSKDQAVELELLIKLQDIQAKIREIEKSTNAIPQNIELIQSGLERSKEEIEQTQKLHQSLESQLRSYENEIVDRDEKLKQYQGQLLTVKTNIEYAAMLKQIDSLKRMNEETGEQIFHVEEEMERLRESRAEKETAYKITKEECDAKVKEQRKELDEIQKEIEKLKSQAKTLRAKISPRLLSIFERISRARDGIAVVLANGGICQGCYTSIRPQVFDEIRRGGSIVQCESCSRILFYDVNS